MEARDLAQYLGDCGYGTLGHDLYYAYQPPDPDDCITVLDGPGQVPPVHVPLRYPVFQVLFRADEYETAMTKAQGVFSLLHRKENYALGDWWVFLSHAESEPVGIGVDENGRHEVSLNIGFDVAPYEDKGE
jgi:hypothetical protein